MAGDWIKMRTSLLTNPRVNGIARALEESAEVAGVLATGSNVCMSSIVTRSVMRHVTVSSLLVVWGAANEHTKDGVLRNADLFDIDDMVGIPGFGHAMESVGWLEYDAEQNSVTLPNFNEYNTSGDARSAVAKTNAERQKEYRGRKKDEESNVTSDVTRYATSNVTSNRRVEKSREEKNREEKEEQHALPVQRPDAPEGAACASMLGAICMAMKAAGTPGVNPSHPDLTKLVDSGADIGMFVGAAQAASKKQKGFAYALATVAGQMRDAATLAGTALAVPLVESETAYQRSARLRVAEISPELARPAPGEQRQSAVDYFRTIEMPTTLEIAQ